MTEMRPRVTQRALADLDEWQQRVENHYKSFVLGVDYAFSQIDDRGNIPGELKVMVGDLAKTLISTFWIRSQKAVTLQKDLDLVKGHVAPGQFSCRRSQNELYVVDSSNPRIFHIPTHVVFMIKNNDCEAQWTNTNWTLVFKRPLKNILFKRSDQIFRSKSGRDILHNDLEVIRTGRTGIYDEAMRVRHKKLQRIAVRFVLNRSQIGVICWDKGRSLIPRAGNRNANYSAGDVFKYALSSMASGSPEFTAALSSVIRAASVVYRRYRDSGRLEDTLLAQMVI